MISIIIPIYNREKYLRKCFDSVINQTFSDFEVILIDDGSTDTSLQICEEYVAKDQRFKLFSQKNQGVSVARNQGIEKATRPYITFIDSDDWIDEDMIELLYNQLMEHQADISCCGYFIDELQKTTPVWNDGSVEVWDSKEALTKLLINEEMRDFACMKLFKKKLFKQVQFPKNTYFEDIFVMYRIFEATKQVVKINIPKYHYRQHQGNITANNTANIKKENDLFSATVTCFDFIKNNPKKIQEDKYSEVHAGLFRLLYRLKKQTIARYNLQTESYKELSERINERIKQEVAFLDVPKFGFFRYMGMKLIVYCPFIFALSYVLSGKKKISDLIKR